MASLRVGTVAMDEETILDAYERLFFSVVIRARRDLVGPVAAHRSSAVEFIRVIAGDDVARRAQEHAGQSQKARRG